MKKINNQNIKIIGFILLFVATIITAKNIENETKQTSCHCRSNRIINKNSKKRLIQKKNRRCGKRGQRALFGGLFGAGLGAGIGAGVATKASTGAAIGGPIGLAAGLVISQVV
jgi:hypothetical protein